MRYLACDLHIHTALSPCADSDMTPCNIVNMAKINGLDVIAITDHQSCSNVAAVSTYASSVGLCVIPGMELETSESIHMICLFPSLENALEFEKIVRQSLPDIKNNAKIFGEQLLFNESDEIIGLEEQMLLISSGLSFQEAIRLVHHYQGICYPAHIDRDAFSVLSVLGTIPEEYSDKTVEISSSCDIETLYQHFPEAKMYDLVRSSDAHYLKDILEPGFMVEIAQSDKGESDISLVIRALQG